jgi:hypothetical protein
MYGMLVQHFACVLEMEINKIVEIGELLVEIVEGV